MRPASTAELYLENRHGAWKTRVEDGIARSGSPEDRILAVFDVLGDLFTQPDYRGCAFMNAAAEARPDSVESRAADRFRGWIHELFQGLVTELGVPDPDRLVLGLVVLYDGANTTAQMDRAFDAAQTAKAMASMLIAASRALVLEG